MDFITLCCSSLDQCRSECAVPVELLWRWTVTVVVATAAVIAAVFWASC